ncbi:MAG TPA: hypothetical protein PLS93_16295 [Accumulibacter sp.]|nr:hypothetical protein [Accumulibacter sp.]
MGGASTLAVTGGEKARREGHCKRSLQAFSVDRCFRQRSGMDFPLFDGQFGVGPLQVIGVNHLEVLTRGQYRNTSILGSASPLHTQLALVVH